MWETNFVPDLSTFKLMEWKARGAGGSNIMFVLANGTMHAHMSEMPVGTYKKGHRHGPDFHVFAVTGHGYSIYWYEGDSDFQRFDWQHGAVFAPADRMFHQHFNTSPEPARYLAVAFGGLRYPFAEDKKKTFMGMDVSIKDGGRQVEYEDEDPRIHRLYAAELGKVGIQPRMDEFLAPAAR
jgi:gentisate 1,2-dioxygenase